MELLMANATASSSLNTPLIRHSTDSDLAIIVSMSTAIGLFAIGIPGNLLALFILHRTRSTTNQKHGFMLRCLITNDCITLVDMLVHIILRRWLPDITINNLWLCRFRVLVWAYILGSGCVAFVMAFERWLALTKPFFYQKHISLRLLKRMMAIFGLGYLCLVCAPLFGFGLYWDEATSTCVRYRNAKKPLAVLYIYVNLSYCVFLCFAIVYMNLAVMKALCMKDSIHNTHNMRRITRRSSQACNEATNEERKFGWLMICLSVVFLVCWIPKMISAALTRFIEEAKIRPFSIVADMLLTVHFVLDPYIYVLQHWTLVKSIFRIRRTRAVEVRAQ